MPAAPRPIDGAALLLLGLRERPGPVPENVCVGGV